MANISSHATRKVVYGINSRDAATEVISHIDSGAGTTVFGRSGNIVATIGDYTAAQVTNAVDSSSTYSNPSWITGLAGTKISGDIAGDAASITGTITESQVVGLVSDLAARLPAGSNTQFQYNNSTAFAGSAVLTQSAASTVSIIPITTGIPGLIVQPAAGSSFLTNTEYSIMEFQRPSDGLALGKVTFANYSGSTNDWPACFIYATALVLNPGPAPANYSNVIQVILASGNSGTIGGGLPGFSAGPNLVFGLANYGGGIVSQEAFRCEAIGNTTGSHIYTVIYSAGRTGVTIQGASGQTGNLQQWMNSSPTLLSCVRADGSFGLVQQADGAGVANNSLYYSTTTSKLCYKDPAGVLHTLA